MRTKQIGKPKPKPPQLNGTPAAKSKKPSEDALKSPQPQLTEKENQNLRAWLDKSDKPFGIINFPNSKKRKREGTHNVQDDLWDDRLSIQYEVKPRDKWEMLRKYKKFTVGNESIATGQCILVKFDNTSLEYERIDTAGQWKAKVLEVRALDQEHVYIRVAWLNRPEDLETGRQPWHGKSELLPTNHLDVIDAMAVNGSVDIVHWQEDDDDDTDMMIEDQYFWRQTLDLHNGKGSSKLRKICIDQEPQNPDEMILQCSNPECRKWLHLRCIAKEAVKQACMQNQPSEKASTENGKQGPKSATLKKLKKGRQDEEDVEVSFEKGSLASAKASIGGYTSEVFIEGQPAGDDVKPAARNEIRITSPDGSTLMEDVCCLFCKQAIADS